MNEVATSRCDSVLLQQCNCRGVSSFHQANMQARSLPTDNMPRSSPHGRPNFDSLQGQVNHLFVKDKLMTCLSKMGNEANPQQGTTARKHISKTCGNDTRPDCRRRLPPGLTHNRGDVPSLYCKSCGAGLARHRLQNTKKCRNGGGSKPVVLFRGRCSSLGVRDFCQHHS